MIFYLEKCLKAVELAKETKALINPSRSALALIAVKGLGDEVGSKAVGGVLL